MHVASLEEQIRTSLGAWLHDRADVGAYRTLRDGLSGIVALADSRADAAVGGVADGVAQMLDRFGRESGELPEQALATLRQSIEALASWCARSAQADAAADSVTAAVPGHGAYRHSCWRRWICPLWQAGPAAGPGGITRSIS